MLERSLFAVTLNARGDGRTITSGKIYVAAGDASTAIATALESVSKNYEWFPARVRYCGEVLIRGALDKTQ